MKRYNRRKRECLLLDVVVLLSSNVQNADSSAAEEQNVVGEGSDLSSQFNGGNKNQSSGRGSLRRVGWEGLQTDRPDTVSYVRKQLL